MILGPTDATCSFSSSDTIDISGLSKLSANTVSFYARVEVTGDQCFKKIETKQGTDVYDRINSGFTANLLKDDTYSLYGSEATFFTLENKMAGVITTASITGTAGAGSAQPAVTSTDQLHIFLNQATDYFSYPSPKLSNTVFSDAQNDAKTATCTLSLSSTNVVKCEYSGTGTEYDDFVDLEYASFTSDTDIDSQNPTSMNPKWSSTGEDQRNYEVCVVRQDATNADLPKAVNCRILTIDVTNQDADDSNDCDVDGCVVVTNIA